MDIIQKIKEKKITFGLLGGLLVLALFLAFEPTSSTTVDYTSCSNVAAPASTGTPTPGGCLPYRHIWALGDSITAQYDRTPPYGMWEGTLDLNMSSDSLTHVLATSGWTCAQILSAFKANTTIQADNGTNFQILLYCGVNDVAGSTAQTISDITEIYNIATAKGNSFVFMSIQPRFGYCSFIHTVNGWMKPFALAHGVPYVDIYNASLSPGHDADCTPDNSYMDGSGFHPIDPDGYMKMGLTIWDQAFQNQTLCSP